MMSTTKSDDAWSDRNSKASFHANEWLVYDGHVNIWPLNKIVCPCGVGIFPSFTNEILPKIGITKSTTSLRWNQDRSILLKLREGTRRLEENG